MMRARRIYVASSWRNPIQPDIVAALRTAGHEVYDFRNPAPGQKGFAWRDCGGEAATDGPGTGAKTISSYLEAIRSDRAAEGFRYDKGAMDWADTCVLVLPCGRSAHLEAGFMAGEGKDTYILLHEDKFEPELMYLLNTSICTNIVEVIDLMAKRHPGDVCRWHAENGGHFCRPAGLALRLLREAVELCVAAGAIPAEIAAHTESEISKARERGEIGGNLDALPGEVADVHLLLDVFANYAGIDIKAEARKKMDINWTRQCEAGASGALYRLGNVPYYDKAEKAA
jgi:NTP pyrophosphatase (non-canonical NTP hydrolase)